MGKAEDVKETLKSIRAAIDSTDEQILRLLNERAGFVLDVGRRKAELGGAFYVPGREEGLIRRLQEANPGPFPTQAIRNVWKEIISASLSLEQPMTVAYLGPQATFTHQACLRQFGLSAQYQPARTIAEVFDVVEKGKANYGVIPIENTTEGVVSYTLDMFLVSELKIAAEVYLRITHNLLNLSGRREDVARIYSHPQAIAQCRGWVEEHFPGRSDRVTFVAGPLLAQTKPVATKPAPRLPNGQPDFAGLWQGGGPINDISQGLPKGETLPLLPSARKILESRLSKDDPQANCLPSGVPRIAPYPWRIVQTPTHMFFLFEGNIHSYRQIFMDGRKHPPELDPTWYGHSIGWWEKDTIVIDTVGFNDKAWFDSRGTPHTERLHTIERWTRLDLGRLENKVTIDDPGAYSKPFEVTINATTTIGDEVMEYICQDGNQYGINTLPSSPNK
jgi:chorismate mutase-like protein